MDETKLPIPPQFAVSVTQASVEPPAAGPSSPVPAGSRPHVRRLLRFLFDAAGTPQDLAEQASAWLERVCCSVRVEARDAAPTVGGTPSPAAPADNAEELRLQVEALTRKVAELETRPQAAPPKRDTRITLRRTTVPTEAEPPTAGPPAGAATLPRRDAHPLYESARQILEMLRELVPASSGPAQATLRNLESTLGKWVSDMDTQSRWGSEPYMPGAAGALVQGYDQLAQSKEIQRTALLKKLEDFLKNMRVNKDPRLYVGAAHGKLPTDLQNKFSAAPDYAEIEQLKVGRIIRHRWYREEADGKRSQLSDALYEVGTDSGHAAVDA